MRSSGRNRVLSHGLSKVEFLCPEGGGLLTGSGNEGDETQDGEGNEKEEG